MGPPHPSPSSRQARLSSSSSNATHSGFSDHRTKAAYRKENQFLYRNGSKFHAYDRDKAPYPVSFDRDVLEEECVDNAMLLASKNGPSFIDFDDEKGPKRCLDIGTGLGVWVVSAAKLWKHTTFVGLDMVNVQIPPMVLEPDIADRIEWVHSNFLRNKLPFDDDEFDHVRIQFIGSGVPENKWYPLYEEIRRVMKPGATIEHLEEDILFPVLPRWYTNALRTHSRGVSTGAPASAQQRLSFPHVSDTSHLIHEHEFLDTLYQDVWSSRFINQTPTSTLPSYFGAYFERVLSPPVIHIFIPQLIPFAPLPGLKDDVPPFSSHPHNPPYANTNGNGTSETHSNGHSVGIVPSRMDTVVENSNSLTPSPSSTLHTSAEDSIKGSLSPSPSVISFIQDSTSIIPMSISRRDSEAASILSSKSQSGSLSSGSGSGSSKSGKRPSVMLQAAYEGTTLGRNAEDIVPTDKANEQFEQTLYYMHFRHTVITVLATKEAMWDELMVRVHKNDESLKRFGWKDEDYNEQASRARFDFAVSQFESDMRARMSLWNCAVKHGWQFPARDPPSKAEIVEEMHLRREISEAQRLAFMTEEVEPPCRCVRVLTGMKEA